MTGAEIKKARLDKGLSLRGLGEAIGLSAAFLCEIEKGKKKPSQINTLNIADQLGIPMRICPHCQGTGLLNDRTPRS